MGRETENKIVNKKNDTVCLKAGEKGSGFKQRSQATLNGEADLSARNRTHSHILSPPWAPFT